MLCLGSAAVCCLQLLVRVSPLISELVGFLGSIYGQSLLFGWLVMLCVLLGWFGLRSCWVADIERLDLPLSFWEIGCRRWLRWKDHQYTMGANDCIDHDGHGHPG